MGVYEYRGLSSDGKDVGGIIDAESPKTARTKLRQIGIYPTEVLEGSGIGSHASRPSPFALKTLVLGQKVGLLDLSVATRQLATLLAANLPLMESLTALMDQVEHKELKKIMASIRELPCGCPEIIPSGVFGYLREYGSCGRSEWDTGCDVVTVG